MDTVKVIQGKKHTIKVVASNNQKEFISIGDVEMDARALEAVKSALEKAKFCKKPVAKYDFESKRAYIEYPAGVKKYIE